MFNKDSEVIKLGRMAIFYLPVKKLREQCPTGATWAEFIDKALLRLYQGVTKITENVEGSFVMGAQIVKDDHVRYEVSFKGKKKVKVFVTFLKGVCRDLEEEEIYLTMGDRSYLIKPSPESHTS